MNKSAKIPRRPAGIPLSISLKPRPNDGNDLATDIFNAVKNDTNQKISIKNETAQTQPAKPEKKVSLPPITTETSQKKQVEKITTNNINQVNTIVSANPIERTFEKSKAKELYQILLNLTHKSLTPTDKVRVPRSYLLANTNIKTRITLDQNLKRLEKLGLIKITSIIGEQEGNLYQVNLLENVNF